MKVTVTGGAGFIGSNLVKLLLEKKCDVTVLDDLSSGHAVNLDGLPVTFIRDDVRNADAVGRAVAGSELVFHLAASVGNKRSVDDPIADSEINVIGTLNVLEQARHRGIRRVVFSSSAGIFGELKTLPISEDHPAEPDSPYGASKLAAEKHCLAYSKLYRLEAACLRYFNVYGINQRFDAYGNVIPIFVHRVLRGEDIVIFGDGEQTRDFVNARDVAQANYLAGMASGASGAYNIASGSRVTINELAQWIAEAAGVELRVTHAPPRSFDVRHSIADISAASAAFGFKPCVDLRAGLIEYVAWARDHLVT